ncbi:MULTISPECIES: LysM peptidoglycan-binding domain-containing protein [Sphingobacterium]|uniref:LysM peptidoglycan-binding domain-containing protein n=1 Tax=Sphingobacterium TaxID=28453 RepID=UPI001FB46950|nr:MULTISPECIES: LysM peptidoglycan-binding domain-containing protein [Sphingobacterium]MCS3554018.1 LysM repeat protein [Sphingobacterium sp. JUb21]MCW2260430.1 LysM repeat protein [Sphingobacterium kitahiroshimense]
MMNILSKSTTYKTLAFLSLAMLAINHNNVSASTFTVAAAPDSIGVEKIDGQEYVLFKIEKGDNYYQLSKKYKTTVGKITELNGNKTLALGQIVKIPTGRMFYVTPNNSKNSTVKGSQKELIDYKVGDQETLYAISRKFDVTVEEIKRANNLRSNSISGGQILKIPNNSNLNIPQKPDTLFIGPDTTAIEEPVIAANKYGIREKTERGIGVWIDGLNENGTSNLALHKTAAVGTVLKITNPMTRSVTYAKVVGKFNENADTHNAIVVLSKSAAAYIGALDKRFQVEITYGVPLED